jgi:hypothetical protein
VFLVTWSDNRRVTSAGPVSDFHTENVCNALPMCYVDKEKSESEEDKERKCGINEKSEKM